MNLHCRYYHFQTLDSTNAFAKRELFSFSENDLTIITADQQTHGYGRLQRHWHSPQDGNLYLTLVLFDERPPILFSKLAVLCLEQLVYTIDNAVKIKWPNDLLVYGKKIAGVLVEVKQKNEYTAIIIGIGLNINMSQKEIEQIPKRATSLTCLTDEVYDPTTIQQKFIDCFLSHLHFSKEAIFELWRKKISWMIGSEVTIELVREKISGIIQGFEADGTLLLDVGNSTIRRITTGDLL